MEAQHANALGELSVVDCDKATISETEQVLRGVEAEGRRDARSGDLGRAKGLRRVFDQGNILFGAIFSQRVEIFATPSVQMGKQDAVKLIKLMSLYHSFVAKLQVIWIDVQQNRMRPNVFNRFVSRPECYIGQSHFMARAYTYACQRQCEGISAIGTTDEIIYPCFILKSDFKILYI